MSLRQLKKDFIDPKTLNAKDLRKHVLVTYTYLRIWMAIIAFAFPFVLWRLGLSHQIPLRNSISDYYHTNMHSVFVGVILVIGSILIIYKGYTSLENRVLNVAGFLAMCIAIFPNEPPQPGTWSAPMLHNACAIIFFILIAYVCIFRSQDTLQSLKDHSSGWYIFWVTTYVILGLCMAVIPIGTAIFVWYQGQPTAVFALETVAVCVFAIYWLAKTLEVHWTLTEAEFARALGVPAEKADKPAEKPKQEIAPESLGGVSGGLRS